MGIFHIAHYTILRNVRDTGTLLQMLLLPIVLIFILGNALNVTFEPQSMGKISVGYLNEDQAQGGMYFQEFIHSQEIQQLLEVIPVDSVQEGLQLVQENNAEALIIIEESFTDNLQTGAKAQVNILADPSTEFRHSVIQNIVDSFIYGANTVEAVHKLGFSEAGFVLMENIIEDRAITTKGDMPRAMDYYAVTMLVMTIMYGAMYANYGMSEDYLNNTGLRIKSAPIKPFQHYIGKTLGNMVTVFMQILILILFTKYIYQVNWGDNIFTVLLITFSLALLATGLGTMMCMVIKNQVISASVLNVLIPVLTFVAGGYIRITKPGPVLSLLQYLSPNYLAQTAIFNTVYGGPAAQTIAFMTAIWLIIAVTFGVAQLAERWRVA